MNNLKAFSEALGAAINLGVQERVPPAVMVNALELAKHQILQHQLANAQARAAAELTSKIIPAGILPTG